MAVGWEEIAYNAGIAFVVCVVCLAIFGFVRRSKAVGTLYTAKRHLKIPFRCARVCVDAPTPLRLARPGAAQKRTASQRVSTSCA